MTKSLAASAETMTSIVTRDRVKAQTFYAGVLGFKQIGEDDFAAVFDLNGVMMQLSTVKDHKHSPHTVLGWKGPNIDAEEGADRERRDLPHVRRFGQDSLGIWSAPGGDAKVA